MKKSLHKFMQLANVSDEKEFYKLFPSEEHFFKKFPQARPQETAEFGDVLLGGFRNMQSYDGLSDKKKEIVDEYDTNGYISALSNANKLVKKVQNQTNAIEAGLRNGLMSIGQLLPETRPDKDVFRASVDNPFAYGTNTQAIYANGGDIIANPIEVQNNGSWFDDKNLPKIKLKNNYTGSFKEAFKNARKELGDNQVFTWKGKKYTTNLKTKSLNNATPKQHQISNTHLKENENLLLNKSGDFYQLLNHNNLKLSEQQLTNLQDPGKIYKQTNPDVLSGKYSYTGAANDVMGNNNWSKNVLDPALLTQTFLEIVPSLMLTASKSALNKTAKSLKNQVFKEVTKENLKQSQQAADNFFLQNLKDAKKANPYPINQWKTTPSEFEWQGESPIQQWANSPTILNIEQSGMSPVQQMLDMEHAWSPISRMGNPKLMETVQKAFPEEFLFENQSMSPVQQFGKKNIKKLTNLKKGEHGLSIHSGGNVETLGQNPYTGNTLLFNGASHADGGIKINYNGSPVEVQGGEPAFQNKEGDLVILGGMKVPGMNKTFQSLGKQIGKEEASANKILSKAENVAVKKATSRFDIVKNSTSEIMKDAAEKKLQKAAIQKENLAHIQDTILQYAEYAGEKPKKMAEKFAKKGIKISYDDGQSWDNKSKIDLTQEIKPIITPNFEVSPSKLKMASKKETPYINTDLILNEKTHDLMGNVYNIPQFPKDWSRRQIDNYLNQNPIDGISSYNQWNDYMEDGGEIPKAGEGYTTKNKAMSDNLSPEQMKYADMIMEEALKLGMTREQASTYQRMVNIESRFKPNINTSKAGAAGIAQFMPGTAKQYGVQDVYRNTDDESVRKTLNAGLRYFKDLSKQFNSDNLAVAAYNWGPGRVQNKLKKYNNDETLVINNAPEETKNYYNNVRAVPNDNFWQNKGLYNSSKSISNTTSSNEEIVSKKNIQDNIPYAPTMNMEPRITPISFRDKYGNPVKTQELANASFREPVQQKQINKPSLADKNKLRLWDFMSDIPALFDTPDYVQGQQFNPQPYQPYQVSLQDRLNENNSTFRSQMAQLTNNPEALSILAAEKYKADNAVLAEQFRINQGITNETYNKNVALNNEANLKNLELSDLQYQRQTMAKTNTNNRRQQALADIQNKIAQNERDNMKIRLYENSSNYRMNNNGEMQNYNNPYYFTDNSTNLIPISKEQYAAQKQKYEMMLAQQRLTQNNNLD